MKNLLSMKTPVLALFISLVAFGACVSNKQTQPSTDYTQLVNPFIGTDFTGNTYPGAQAPFGMVQLSPDNGLPGWDRISGYFYPDSTIAGFSHTHLSGTGAGDLYDISFMPVTLPYQEAEAPLGIYSKFSHADEEASAGYYRVLLKDYDINVELTATERCGIQRYTFPEGESAVFLNLKKAMNWDFTNDSYIEIIDSCTIQGYRFSEGWARDQHVYFRTRFSKPFASVEMDTTAIALKGIGDFDAEKALEACVATANLDDYRGIGLYKKLGYIPYNIKDEYNAENWSLSKTLEYAFDDYCIAEMARKMGRTQLADEFYKRSQNYRNVFNPASSFMQPIDDKGVFQPNFSPDDYTAHICESNGWQYFWSVQQDIKGLIALTGGKDRFTEKLDSMFTYIPAGNADLPLFSTGMIGQYAHGNEPSHHVIYLYNKVRQPWKTQKYAAQVMHDLYFNAPAGLCGNEDCGQMSAWYVFSAMGFYPVNPVSGEYEIGTPLFPEIQMHLDNGKTFTVLAPGVSRENIYIQSVKVNGQPYDKSYITHRQIMDGATVEFEMGPEPGNIWYR